MSPRLRRSSTCRVLLFALTAVALAAPVTAGNGFETRAGASQAVPDGTAGTTEIVVDLAADGDAVIRVHRRVEITGATGEAAFENLTAAFERGEVTVGAQAFVEAARRVSLERPASASAVERTGSLVGNGSDRTGVLTATVRWTNFARQNGSHLYIDDVLETDQGLWLPGLTADQTLTVTVPDGYGVRSAAVPVRGGELRWQGPATFDSPSRLEVTFVGTGSPNDNNSTGGTTNDTGGANGTDTGGDGAESGSSTGLMLFAGAVVVAVAAGVVVVASRREQVRRLLAEETESTERASDRDGVEPAADGNGETDREELLSDEEQVAQLIADSGGRMKQAAIVEATDWSDAKVSQVTSAMEEDGQIEKLRIGRENVISLVGEDEPDSDRSP